MQRQTIGRYQIREELGRGAMGIVYCALDSLIGRTVAIKTIRLSAFHDDAERERLRERLMREARSAGVLSHRNIVTVYDVGEEDGTAFIAMEYVAGQTVEQLLREQGGLEREQVIAIITQVAAALDYAHSQGVVHRDIKPGNIMIAADGSVRITDFGVAKILSHQATQSDLMLGTPNYMSPEQIDARGVDGRTDQFALGVIAFELLTGERPFHAEALSALFLAILREEPPPPHLLNPTLTERVSAVISRALEKAPVERFATCAAFAKALTQSLAACQDWQPLGRAAVGTMATVAAASPMIPPEPPVELEPPAFTQQDEVATDRTSRSFVLAALALTILGAAGVAVYLFLLKPTPEPTPVAQAPAAAATRPPEVNTETRPSPLAEPVATPPPAPVATETNTVPVPAPPKPVSPSGPVSGEVDIVSQPSGATVRIDDTRDQCKTPCSMELSQGRHVLHFTLEGHRNGTLVVTVPQESTASVRLDPRIGSLMVNTLPAGTQILLNGQLQKDRSPTVLKVTPGKYKLTLRREGREHSRDIEVRDEALTQVDFTWP